MSRFNFKAALVLIALVTLPSLQAGSLWREGITDERGMVADKRAKRVGDILSIVVQETAAFTNTLDLKTNKESKTGISSAVSDIVNQFLFNIPNTILGKKVGKTASDNGIVIPTVPTIPVSGSNSYTGGGEIQNKQTIQARAAVQVMDVLPNGNLVVEGVRRITFSNERQYVTLRGIVRPYDIQPDNTVISTAVADAHIDVVAEGTLTEAQKKGWLLRFSDKVNPF